MLIIHAEKNAIYYKTTYFQHLLNLKKKIDEVTGKELSLTLIGFCRIFLVLSLCFLVYLFVLDFFLNCIRNQVFCDVKIFYSPELVTISSSGLCSRSFLWVQQWCHTSCASDPSRSRARVYLAGVTHWPIQ